MAGGGCALGRKPRRGCNLRAEEGTGQPGEEPAQEPLRGARGFYFRTVAVWGLRMRRQGIIREGTRLGLLFWSKQAGVAGAGGGSCRSTGPGVLVQMLREHWSPQGSGLPADCPNLALGTVLTSSLYSSELGPELLRSQGWAQVTDSPLLDSRSRGGSTSHEIAINRQQKGPTHTVTAFASLTDGASYRPPPHPL